MGGYDLSIYLSSSSSSSIGVTSMMLHGFHNTHQHNFNLCRFFQPYKSLMLSSLWTMMLNFPAPPLAPRSPPLRWKAGGLVFLVFREEHNHGVRLRGIPS